MNCLQCILSTLHRHTHTRRNITYSGLLTPALRGWVRSGQPLTPRPSSLLSQEPPSFTPGPIRVSGEAGLHHPPCQPPQETRPVLAEQREGAPLALGHLSEVTMILLLVFVGQRRHAAASEWTAQDARCFHGRVCLEDRQTVRQSLPQSLCCLLRPGKGGPSEAETTLAVPNTFLLASPW